MQRYVAFLRAINVGGRSVKMEDLRQLFSSLGVRDVNTFIQSGNVIFQSADDAADLEQAIEVRLREALGYEVATFLRTDAELASLAVQRPFDEAEYAAGADLHVCFLKHALESARQQTLMALANEIDTFRDHDRQVFWLRRKQLGDSRFTNARFERALGIQSTIRTISTVRRLSANLAHLDQSAAATAAFGRSP